MLTIEIQGKQILITETVIQIFRAFLQRDQRESEKGGLILGQVSDDERCVFVCRASLPSSHDRSTRTSFDRKRMNAQQIVEYEFYNSEGKNTYLGEWHTHPTNKAIPSPQDVHMIAEQLATNEMRVGFILLFVIASEELYIGLCDGHKMSSVVIKAFAANE